MKYELFQGDCLKVLAGMKPVKTIFADPPDNINLGYGEYKDKLPDDQYVVFLERCINLFVAKAEITWLSFNARWTPAVGSIVYRLNPKFWEVKPCVQTFTFGQHNANDLGNNHRPLWRIMRRDAQLYPDQIRVASWRQLNGDKRAAAGGRVPGDVFDMQYPSPSANVIGSWLSAALDDPAVCTEMKTDIREWFDTHTGDVFDFPRVTGNSAQRCDWHPTQLHEELVKRCVLLSTGPKDRTIDPFGGTGTTLRVCRALKRPCSLIELDKGYCTEIAKANGLQPTKAGYGASR